MPYTKDEMLDDFRKDVARLEAENARLRTACSEAHDTLRACHGLHNSLTIERLISSAVNACEAALSPATEEPKP
jgi:hypothetical protein